MSAVPDWIRPADQTPENGQLIVKRWANGNVWAGIHTAHPKHESFDAWLPLPNEGTKCKPLPPN